MAYTVDQCKRVIALQDRIDILQGMITVAPDKLNNLLKITIKHLEKEQKKYLSKHIKK